MDCSTQTGTPTGKRWLGSGRSSDRDAATAGAAAVAQALRAGTDPGLLIVFCSESYDLDALLDGIRTVAVDVPLVGCTTAGEISAGGPGDGGVVVMAMGGTGFSVATAAATGASSGLREAGATAARCMAAVEPRAHRVLLLLTDGLAGDQQEVVRGAYSVVGAQVPIVGGCAGDNLKMSCTFQLHGHEVLEDAVVGAAIASDAPIGIGISHGWSRVGEPMLVTGSSGTTVHTLDDEPALDVYLRRLEAPPEALTDPAAFTRFAITHPLGLSRRSGEEVRFIAEADFATRSLVCIAHVPAGEVTWIMEGDHDSVLQATEAACAQACRGSPAGHRWAWWPSTASPGGGC